MCWTNSAVSDKLGFMPAKKLNVFNGVTGPVTRALGSIIRQQRRLRHLDNDEDFAASSDLTRQGLAYIEANQRYPSFDTLEHIAGALGMKVSELTAVAEKLVANWPPRCRICNNCCIEDGRLKWLNPTRGCIRPAR